MNVCMFWSIRRMFLSLWQHLKQNRRQWRRMLFHPTHQIMKKKKRKLCKSGWDIKINITHNHSQPNALILLHLHTVWAHMLTEIYFQSLVHTLNLCIIVITVDFNIMNVPLGCETRICDSSPQHAQKWNGHVPCWIV